MSDAVTYTAEVEVREYHVVEVEVPAHVAVLPEHEVREYVAYQVRTNRGHLIERAIAHEETDPYGLGPQRDVLVSNVQPADQPAPA